MTEIRPARPTEPEDMAEVQNAIHRAGLRASPVDVALVRERYPLTLVEAGWVAASSPRLWQRHRPPG